MAAAVFSVSYFSMLLKNFVAAYQSLREVCAISGPCTSTRTWSFFHCSPYLSQLTRCGHIQNEPSSVAWRPLSQLTHCGLKTNKPSSVPWRPLSQLTRCGRKRSEPSSFTWRPLANWPVAVSKQTNSVAVVVSNKVNPAVSLHKNATIFSVRSATRSPCQALVTAYRKCKAMLDSICTVYCENSLQCSSSFKKGVALKESLNRRKKRDREPSRIPVKRILNVFRKKTNRKKVQLFVRKTIPNSSFITCLSQNYKTWQLW